jgi:threonine/homoserine/homoserine lactone efflux protein
MHLSPAAAIRAFAIGLAFAAQVGPMSVFCMRRTLGAGWRAGMVVGAGIATADAIYAGLAAFGFAALSRWIAAHAQPIHWIAAAILIGMGVKLLLQTSSAEPAALVSGGRYVESVLLTLSNPMTILSYVTAIGALAPLDRFDAGTAASSVLGVFAGSLAWWIVLVCAVSRFRHLVDGSLRRAIDRISALTLIGFGVKTAATD